MAAWLIADLISFLGGYLVGSVPIGVVVGRLAGGIDIRRFGSGNIGASNTYRNLGFGAAAAVGVGTFLQGFLPAWLAGLLTGSDGCRAAAGAGAVVGYGWSFLLRLRGGRAVGTATGALAAMSPPALIALLACYAVGGVARRPAPWVLCGLLAYLGVVWGTGQRPELAGGATLVVVLVLLKRLDGVIGDLREERGMAVVIDRLINDRRPGQRLVGPIE
jgi:acyl-phosphate glycerol 3-phosphate acyltransferase